MDLFNRILVGRWQSPLVRLFGMKTVGSPVPTLAPEIAPGIDVNQRDDATLAFLRGERLCGVARNIAASVGNFNALQIRNPATSGLLIEVEQLLCNSTSTHSYGLLTNGSDLGLITNAFVRDDRWLGVNGSRTPAGRCSYDNPAALLSLFPSGFIAAGTTDYQPVNIVVPPGSAFYIGSGSTNVTSVIAVHWRERPFDPSELSTG